MRARAWIVGLLLSVAACAAPSEPEIAERGLGLADGVIGSCAEACGDATAAGNCWCDEACVEFGDCCEDKVDVCGGEAPDPSDPVLCREVQDCPTGLTCDQSACYSGCREGEECEDACVGMCVEPKQQSLPHPSGDVPEPEPQPHPEPDGDDDGDGEPAGDVCNCPADDLCVDLCPVCPPEIPEEDCQCSLVCVSL